MTYTIDIINAAAQKCVLEYVSVSMWLTMFFSHDGHLPVQGLEPTFTQKVKTLNFSSFSRIKEILTTGACRLINAAAHAKEKKIQ